MRSIADMTVDEMKAELTVRMEHDRTHVHGGIISISRYPDTTLRFVCHCADGSRMSVRVKGGVYALTTDAQKVAIQSDRYAFAHALFYVRSVCDCMDFDTYVTEHEAMVAIFNGVP